MNSLGTNAGEAFGQLGIGIYGKKYLTRDKEIRVQFNYRASKSQKKRKVIRLQVPSPEGADDVIRQWLKNRRRDSFTAKKT